MTQEKICGNCKFLRDWAWYMSECKVDEITGITKPDSLRGRTWVHKVDKCRFDPPRFEPKEGEKDE